MDRYAKSYCRPQCFGYRRPADRHDGIGHWGTHQGDSLTEKKDLDFVTSFSQRIRMQEWKSRFGWVVGTPSALHEYFAHTHLLLKLSILPNE